MDESTTVSLRQPPARPTIEQVRELFAASRREVELVIAGQPEERLITPGPDGWSVKDHLAHLAAWQRSLVALLSGTPRHAALGMDEESYRHTDTEQINDHILASHRDTPLSIVLAEFRAAYDDAVALLNRMSTADIYRPYRDYQPNETDPSDSWADSPVLDSIASNSWDHEPEHLEAIRAQLSSDR
jgi:hypothetical protein